MSKRLAFAAPLLWALAGPAAAHSGCEGLEFDATGLDAQKLRAIARSCEDPAMARLYYNRAYHLELMDSFRALSEALIFRGPDTRVHAHSYRTLIGLYEAFARLQWSQGRTEQALDALNEGYDKATAVAELRLQGRDNRADRLASSQY